MDLNTAVLIVSAYGRGHWLAAELQGENIPVIVIDVSPKLGAWPAADLEGPFGYFQAENQTLEGTKAERLQNGDAFREVERGFTLWLEDGPLELKSPLAEYRLKKLGQHVDVLPSLRSGTATSKNPLALRKWSSENFKKTWLLNLSHQLASTTYHPNSRAVLYGKALKIMDRFLVRRASEEGFAKSTEWLRNKKVEVLERIEILDLSFRTKKQISGVELQGERSGVLQIQQLVWMLNSEESYFVYPKIAHHLFPEGELEPEWCWVRYQLRLKECQERELLPEHVVVNEQVTAPWTHQNLLILQRTAEKDLFDGWLRIPNVQRFNKEYLRIRGENILEILGSRMPMALPDIAQFPQEYYHTHAQIGPSRFPVYASGFDRRRTKSAFSNLLLDGSEVWRNFSWDEMFENQGSIRNSIVKWWKLLQQRKEKERRD